MNSSHSIEERVLTQSYHLKAIINFTTLKSQQRRINSRSRNVLCPPLTFCISFTNRQPSDVLCEVTFSSTGGNWSEKDKVVLTLLAHVGLTIVLLSICCLIYYTSKGCKERKVFSFLFVFVIVSWKMKVLPTRFPFCVKTMRCGSWKPNSRAQICSASKNL